MPPSVRPAGTASTNFGSGQGGGINSIGTFTVHDSTLTDNLAQGAPLAADVVPSQSVLSNSATAGGGIFCLDLFGGPVLIADSTLTGNQAVGGCRAAPALAEGGGLSLVLVPSGVVTGCTSHQQRGSRRGRRRRHGRRRRRERWHRLGERLGRDCQHHPHRSKPGHRRGRRCGSRRRFRRGRRHQRRHRRHPFRFPRQLLADAQQIAASTTTRPSAAPVVRAAAAATPGAAACRSWREAPPRLMTRSSC